MSMMRMKGYNEGMRLSQLGYLHAMGIDYWQYRGYRFARPAFLIQAEIHSEAPGQLLIALARAIGYTNDKDVKHNTHVIEQFNQAQSNVLAEQTHVFVFGEAVAAAITPELCDRIIMTVLPTLDDILAHPLLKKSVWQQILTQSIG